MDLPDDHANIEIVNRILDLLDALRKTEKIEARDTGSPVTLSDIKRKKI